MPIIKIEEYRKVIEYYILYLIKKLYHLSFYWKICRKNIESIIIQIFLINLVNINAGIIALYLSENIYFIIDGNFIRWKGSINPVQQLDHIILKDNALVLYNVHSNKSLLLLDCTNLFNFLPYIFYNFYFQN